MTLNVRNIEIKMAEQGLTQTALAKSIGMCTTVISRAIKRGTADPKTVGKLARGLGASVEEVTVE